MRVVIEKRHIDSYEQIAREANKAIKKSGLKPNKSKYKRALSRNDISVEDKKKNLAKLMHELIISTFSVNIKHAAKKKTLENIKENVALIREILHKVKSINNYLEESLLRELGITKKSLIVRAIKSKTPFRYLKKYRSVLSKSYIDNVEHTVYELMRKIIFFDKKILKGYRKREVRVVHAEKLGIEDLERTLKAESELLDALEAKIPPPSKIKAKLFKKEIFNKWIPMMFALLSSFETEHEKEKIIFSKIKKNSRLRKKIESKIKHIVNEKEKMLQIKEKRALTMKSFTIKEDHRQTFHEYVSAASL